MILPPVSYDLFAKFMFAVLVTEPAFPQYPTQYAGPALWEFATATVPLQTQPALLPSKFAPVFMFPAFVCTNLMIFPPCFLCFPCHIHIGTSCYRAVASTISYAVCRSRIMRICYCHSSAANTACSASFEISSSVQATTVSINYALHRLSLPLFCKVYILNYCEII